MDTGRPVLTRWSVRLTDSRQERRFILNHLPLQRRATLAATVIVLIASVVEWIYLTTVSASTMPPGRATALAAAVLVGLALGAVLRKDRRPRLMRVALICSGPVIAAMISVLILAGVPAAAQGTLWVVGGVIIFYFSARLDVITTIETAAVFSLITIPAWLVSGVAETDLDVVFTAVAVVIAHLFGYIEIRRNFRERRLAFVQREELERFSSIDALTGLTNRGAFDTRADAAWAEWSHAPRPLSAIMADIDHFKVLNDTRGHAAGDVALRLVAAAIREAVPPGEGCCVARYGGEEFVCLLPGYDADEAAAVAETIRASVSRAAIETSAPPGEPARRATLTVSLGVATAAPGMTQIQDLVDAADRELYTAKASGRDAVCVAGTPVTTRVAAHAGRAGRTAQRRRWTGYASRQGPAATPIPDRSRCSR